MKASSERKLNPYNLVVGIAVTGAVLIAVSILLFGNDDEVSADYITKIQEFRLEKDKVFKTGEDSPIEDKESFDGLLYFYPNPDYRVEARISRINDSVPITIMRSDGKVDTYLKYAVATFELDKREHKLVLLQNVKDLESGFLFLPFSDLTAGRETYGGGRYLDIEIPKEETIEIDFNLAYNPYCVYNYRYSCPLPPKENFLDTEIRAGEKNYKE